MNNASDFFVELDRALDEMKRTADLVAVDMHAEATSEKIALSWYLDGKVAFLFGSHTHVPTADALVRPNGTAYITDAGMTGPYSGVIGRIKSAVLKKMRLNVHEPFAVAQGDVRIGAVLAESRLDAWEILDQGIQRRIAAGFESKLILERGQDKVAQPDRIDTAIATAALPDDVRAALVLCKAPHTIEEVDQFV